MIENGGVFYSYSNKIFASWDYCITSDKAAGLKKKNIYQDFQVWEIFAILKLREFMLFIQGCEFRIKPQCYSISHHRK